MKSVKQDCDITSKNFRTTEEEVEHYSRQLQILMSERTSFMQNAEDTKKKNAELIEQLKKENRELKKIRDEIVANRKAAFTAGLSKTTGTSFFDTKDEVYWKRKYDETVNRVNHRRKVLLNLKDKLNEVSDVKNAAYEESPLTRQIRILENKLDKIMIKYNEAHSIRKTYEQIVKRLKEERIGYDNQLAAIERSLKGKEHDYVELLLLSHDAIHAKELAQSELKKYEHKKAAVRKLREKYIEEKKRQLEARGELMEKHEKKELDQIQNEYHEKEIDKTNNQPNFQYADAQIEQNNIKEEIYDYEEGFRKLYEITGVNDVNEIIQKYITQHETTKSLKDLESQYNQKIEILSIERNRLKSELNFLKFEKAQSQTRKQIDEIESNVNVLSVKCERYKLKYERLSKILVNAKAGIEHLNDKLEFFKLDGRPNINVSDETLGETLTIINDKLAHVYKIVKNDPMFSDANDKKHLVESHTLLNSYVNLNLFDKGMDMNNLRKTNKGFSHIDEDDVSEADDDYELDGDGGKGGRSKRKNK